MSNRGVRVLTALPASLLGEVDEIAAAEHRTRSELFREALRRYVMERRKYEKDVAIATGSPTIQAY